VNASKPVAPKLNRVLEQLQPAVHDLRPTVRDLARIAFQPGPDNDLYNLEQTFPPVAQAALDKKNRSPDFGAGKKSVGSVRGAFPEMTDALTGSAPIIAFGRPYTPELMGWFDDFSATGVVDAAGGIVRVALFFDAVSATGAVPLSDRLGRLQNEAGGVRIKQFKRCPGGGDVRAADGSNVFSADQQKQFDCTEADRAAGVYPENKGKGG
jgi:phospholipid/cholesterol/gamma-HCH transport system substrate-binding protein